MPAGEEEAPSLSPAWIPRLGPPLQRSPAPLALEASLGRPARHSPALCSGWPCPLPSLDSVLREVDPLLAPGTSLKLLLECPSPEGSPWPSVLPCSEGAGEGAGQNCRPQQAQLNPEPCPHPGLDLASAVGEERKFQVAGMSAEASLAAARQP